jgi:hypothetical protein
MTGSLRGQWLIACEAVALLGGCQGRKSEVLLPPSGVEVDSATQTPRTWRAWRLEEQYSLGGSSTGDTTLLAPYLFSAAGDHLLFVDHDQRILNLGPDGTLVWQFGRKGSGPREFRLIRDIKVGPGGRIYVNDPENARITVLTPGGRLEHLITVRDVGHAERIAPTADPFRVALVPLRGGPGGDVVVVDTGGHRVRADSVPWPPYRQLTDLARQQETGSDLNPSGRWVMAFSFGDGWFAFGPEGPLSGRRFFVEPTRFPTAIQTRLPNGDLATQMIWTDPSAITLGMIGDTVFVQFGGQGPQANRKLDLYTWSGGRYLYSVELPKGTTSAVVAPGRLYLAGEEPAPWVKAFRRMATREGETSGGDRGSAGPAEPSAGH